MRELPQRSPLFLIYVHDPPDQVKFTCNIADDMALFCSVSDKQSFEMN